MIWLYSYLWGVVVAFIIMLIFFTGKWPEEVRKEKTVVCMAAAFCAIIWPYSMVKRLLSVRRNNRA